MGALRRGGKQEGDRSCPGGSALLRVTTKTARVGGGEEAGRLRVGAGVRLHFRAGQEGQRVPGAAGIWPLTTRHPRLSPWVDPSGDTEPCETDQEGKVGPYGNGSEAMRRRR